MAHGTPAYIANINARTSPELLTPISLSRGDEHSFQEDYLQTLLDNTPQLLPVRDFYRTVTALYSLGREIPVDLGKKQGYIDNLFVTNDAHLVLVETKLHRNPEGIREVVAQTFQYGAAINSMSLMQLEECIRKGQKQGNALAQEETIRARVQAQAAEARESEGLVDDFEDQLETHIRTGELLYLIVGDGVHESVERITRWLNQSGGGAPYKFGLVELRFYKTDSGGSVVVPRTLLRTKEVARHVVVVNVRGAAETVSTVVNEQTQTEGGGTSITSRAIKTAGPAMTRDTLLAEVKAKSNDAYVVVSELLPALEAAGLDSRATSSTLQFGLLSQPEAGEFYPLLALYSSGTYSHLPTSLIAVIGDSAFVEHKRALNAVAPFYRPGEVDDPAKKANELQVRYEELAGHVEELVGVILATRNKALAALSPE